MSPFFVARVGRSLRFAARWALGLGAALASVACMDMQADSDTPQAVTAAISLAGGQCRAANTSCSAKATCCSDMKCAWTDVGLRCLDATALRKLEATLGRAATLCPEECGSMR